MQRQTSYDWKDSNVALFGSDADRKVKKESAELEPAWQPVLKSNKPELFVWRIEQFKVVPWPKELYGQFYDGDSYIILNSYLDNDKLCYDVHFWIGRHSTADEYGTAAYKTVEVDTLLDDLPVQHREVQERESALMRSYFPSITYLSGGCPSGFRHAETREYKPRLLHFKGERQNIVVREVPMSRKALDETDVYILDLGNKAYQWNSKGANMNERFKAAQYLQQLKSSRNGRLETEVVDQQGTESSHAFYTTLTDEDVDPAQLNPADADKSRSQKRLLRLSDETGSLKFEELETGRLSRSNVNEDDVFIIDNGFEIFVYVGANASVAERRNAMAYAHRYLQESLDPLLPVTVLGANSPAKSKREFEGNF